MGRPLFSAAYSKPVAVHIQQQERPAPAHPTYYRWSDRPFDPDAEEFFESDDVVYEAFLTPGDLSPSALSPVSLEEESSTDESGSEPSTRSPSPSLLGRAGHGGTSSTSSTSRRTSASRGASPSADPTSRVPLQIRTAVPAVPRSTSHHTSLPTVSRLPPYHLSRSSSASSSSSSPTSTTSTTTTHHYSAATAHAYTFGTPTPPAPSLYRGPFTNPGARRSMSHIAPPPRIVRALADPVP